MRIGIIGGSGVSPLGNLAGLRSVEQNTAFGPAAASIGRLAQVEVAFLQRHGPEHSLPPHRINHHANIAALRALGIERCLGVFAVGSLRREFKPGDLAALSGFIDCSHSRVWTFYDSQVGHTDFTEPYCPELRASLCGILGDTSCVYVGVAGPRYETPDEIRMFRSLGGHVIGMTGVPEAVLAREAGICYAAIAVVANLAAGLSPTPIDHTDVLRAVEAAGPRVWDALAEVVAAIKPHRDCGCGKNWETWSATFGVDG